MTWNGIITLIMMVLIIILLFRGVSSPGVIFSTVPIIASLLMGFGPAEISGFIGEGLKAISGTLFLMVFAVLYFGLLHEAGVFQALIRLVMRFLGNSITGTMWVTALISVLTQLDGSGATTAICTIPTMRPVYEKQRIRCEALLLIESLASGILCLLPWAPGLCEAAAYVNVDVYELFLWLIPVLVFSLAALFLLCIPLAAYEKRHGAGMTRQEFEEMKREIDKPLEFPLGKGVAVFDGIVTLCLMAALLGGIVKTNFAFGLTFGILLVVNFRDIGRQREYLKKQAPMALDMAVTILGVCVMVGVNQGTGAIADLANWMVSNTSGSLLSHLPFVLCLFSMLLSITIGGSKNSVVLPAVIPMVAAFGFTPVQVLGAVFATGVISANLSLFNATPYLALGLAGVEMKSHLKYSLLPVYGFSLLMLLFMVVSGMLPI
ncbi:SLC13 family permease [uncultured Clostridium sp.]|uniref:SLC13 family permease n=1 Tax=uncultured Clostridium sp. TaxID=59620 RepID=UPI0025EE1F01|nr:SLC13 family permease [uncultured Clostridium sp.]